MTSNNDTKMMNESVKMEKNGGGGGGRRRNRNRRGGKGRNGGSSAARADSSADVEMTEAPPNKRNNNGGKKMSENGGRPHAAKHERATSMTTANGASDVAPPPPKKRNRNRRSGKGNAKNDNTSNTRQQQKETTDMDIDEETPAVPVAVNDTKVTMADPSFMTPYHFKSQPPELLHPLTLKAITEVMKLERLTEIQHKTLQESRSVDGSAVTYNDVLGRARTGTGKTVSFLIPAIETVLASSSSQQGIQVLVISPTRELATQIMTQARQILTFHKNLSVQLIIGGTNMKADISQFNRKLPTILVATPGRIKDHLQNTQLRNGSKFSSAFDNLKVLVLDECDQLLEMGFRQDIFSILSFLPKERQTLLFSATMPKDLRQVMQKAMNPTYKTVDCIHDYAENGNTETNAHVEQTHVVMQPGMDRLVIGVIEVVLAAMKNDPDYKIIAFFPTARLVGYFAELVNLGIRKQFKSSPFPQIVEIHSRKSQGYRNKASDKFRAAKSAILFTSDVSARGVDYPNVTHVIQFGLPDSREQYIHRLGRTGRAGKAGRGWLILADYERNFLKELQKGGTSGGVDVPIDPELETIFSNPPSQEAQDLLTPVLRDQIATGANKELVRSAQQAYQAWLGFYKDRTKMLVGKKSKAEMVQMANEFARLCGLSEQPALLKKTVGKMGLKGVPGLKVTHAHS